MKVGILIRGSQLPDGLVHGLEAAGIQVSVYDALFPEPDVVSPARAGVFLKEIEGCDLIHNLSGSSGLLFAHLAKKPVVSSIPESIAEEDLVIFRAAPDSCFFISENGSASSLGLKEVPGVSLSGGDRVRFYLDVYSRIMALGKKKEHRPWGNYEVLSDDRDDHKVKRITVLPGKRLSLQYHGRRKEHWLIVSGEALVTVGEDNVKLSPSMAVDIPRGTAHRIENVGILDLVFIEVQQGDYFGEDDIVRIEDDFGRI